jgi:hypothetical protein
MQLKLAAFAGAFATDIKAAAAITPISSLMSVLPSSKGWTRGELSAAAE